MSGTVTAGNGTGAKSVHPPNQGAWVGILTTLFAALGGILFGYDTVVISGIQAMQDWSCTFGKFNPSVGMCTITSAQQSLVVATLPAGACVGALFAGPTADFLGRRWAIILGLVIFAVGVAMQVAATALPLFFVGRAIAGCGVGAGYTMVPIYQSECAPKWIRGAVVAAYEWVLNVGAVIAAVVDNATKNRQSHASWRIPISIQFVWAFVIAVGMIFLPESPRWLIKNGRDEDAARSLSRLTSLPPDHPDVQAELDEIHLSFEQEKALGEASYLDCFRSNNNRTRFRTLTGIFLTALNQLTGISFIFYYGTVFFMSSGVQNPFEVQIACTTILAGMILPGMWGVEKFGRRRLLLVGSACMCVCQFLAGIVGVTVPTTNPAGSKALVSLACIFIAFYALAWAPVTGVLLSEIFPLNVRAKAMSLAIASGWAWNFGIGYSVPYMINKEPGSAGLGVKVFFIWGSACAVCVAFIYFVIPETKGLSLEQINLLYQNTTPMHSISYRKKLESDGVELTFKDAQTNQDTTSDYKEKV